MSLLFTSIVSAFLIGGAFSFAYFRLKMHSMNAIHESEKASAMKVLETELNAQISIGAGRLDTMQDTVRNLDRQRNELAEKLKLSGAALEEIRKGHSDLQIEHSSVYTTLGERESEVSQLRETLTKTLGHLEIAQLEQANLESRESAVTARLETMRDTVKDLSERKTELAAQLRLGEAALEEHRKCHSDLLIEHSSVSTTLGERESEVRQLGQNLAETKEQLELAQSEQASLELREAALAARLQEFQRANEQRSEDEAQLRESFRLLSVDALSKNNETFIPLATQVLAAQQKDANDELGKKQEAVDGLLKPMKELLENLQGQTHALEVKREGAYEGLLSEVKNIKETHESLRVQTHQLVSALRDSGTRGSWGAVQLKRCLEFAGMLEHCCFELEKSVKTDDDETQRPDCVVTLPGNRTIVIDSKTPMKAFLDALEASDDVTRQKFLAQHARQLKTHLGQLQSKAYWKQFKDSPDFVICFLPKEALLSAALSEDPDLITFEDGKVLLATPTTLIALMRVIAFGWKQIAVARDAQKINDLALAIYEKLASIHDSFESIGRGIKSTATSWEKMRTQVEGKGSVFSLGRRLRKLDASKAELEEVSEVQLGMHELQSDDWRGAGPVLLPAIAASGVGLGDNE